MFLRKLFAIRINIKDYYIQYLIQLVFLSVKMSVNIKKYYKRFENCNLE